MILILNWAMVCERSRDYSMILEPDGYKINDFPILTSAQVGEDYKTFRNLLKNYSLYSNNLLMGPSLCCIGVTAETGPAVDNSNDFLAG
jgi:hypothetical protein